MEQKRNHEARNDPRHVFLTGGTGFLGSYLGAALLEKGWEVSFLARATNSTAPEDRIDSLLTWHGIAAASRERAHVIEGDLTRPDLGIAPDVRRRLQGDVDLILHCASNTSFAERHREAVMAANVGGLEHLLDFTAGSACAAFHHISTAYVAGRRSGLCLETLVEGATFNNPYEESKCRAEWLVSQRCAAMGIPLTIYRPSIVYGHSQTGRTLQFSALYYPVRTALFMKRLYETDIRERGGERAAAMGVHLEADGSLYLPVRLEICEGGGLNVIPVDFFLAAFFAIMEGASEGGIYHIVDERVTPIEELVAYTQTLFDLSGLQTCPPSVIAQQPRTPLERLVDAYLEAYDPYMKDERIFATDHAGPILAQHGLACPKLDFDIFRRCMNYAVEVDWRV